MPAIKLSNVVFPPPLRPMMAALAPSPTRNETLSNSILPSAKK